MGGWGAGGCSLALRSQNVSDLRLCVEEKTVASNDWIGCNFKPFRCHMFMAATNNDPPPLIPPPSAKMNNTRQKIFCLKTKKYAEMWQIIRPSPPSPFHVDIINVWSLTCLLWCEFVFCFTPITCCLNETRQSSKYCFKTLHKTNHKTFLSHKIVDRQSN